MHLAAKNPSRATGNLGEMIYVYTLWILKRMGNDSKRSKINCRGRAEHALDMPLGDKGEDWETISLKQWWLEMKEHVSHRMFIGPIDIWGIPTEWNQGIKNQRHKLRIGNTGNAGQEILQSTHLEKR